MKTKHTPTQKQTPPLFKLTNEASSPVAKHKINTWKSVVFIFMSDEQSEKETNTFPFKMISERKTWE